MNPRDYAYDIETFPNVATCIIKHVETGTRWVFEVTPWANHSRELATFLRTLATHRCRMVGFNNVGFDFPILDHLLRLVDAQGYATAEQLFAKSQEIIGSQSRFPTTVWNPLVEQLDLFKVHHFDNRAKSTSLKALEFNMRSHSVQTLPYPFDVPLTRDQLPHVLEYNAHDVNETIKFYHHTWPMIAFRDELSVKYGEDFTNYNDTKIGKKYFIRELEKALPGACYDGKEPRQTIRETIPLGPIIFPYIRFAHPSLVQVLDYLKATTISGYDTKSPPELKDLTATINGFTFVFGAGGIHGSVSSTIVRAEPGYDLEDVDVKSYYPNMAIKNRIYPQHLSETFCVIYDDLYQQRSKFNKKQAENAMLKLALNGVYGDSGNPYSPFYDPAYTMAITINGQLLLCMLAEWFLSIDGIEIVQINTDGMTVKLRHDARPAFEEVKAMWQALTLLELEAVRYSAMFIRDVNNYIAIDLEGHIKRKGAYQWDTSDPNNVSQSRTWAQDHSNLIIPRAAEAVMVDGADLATFIMTHNDPFDFMGRAKVTKGTRLVTVSKDAEREQQSMVRYHIAKTGPALVKIMPPLAKAFDKERRIGIDVGWPVNICNFAHDFNPGNLAYEYYIKEARKLIL